MTSTTVLVTGGAGYIGSHMVKALLARGMDVVVVDSLENGHRDAVLGGAFHQGDIADRDFMRGVMREHKVAAVMHFASYIQVGESVREPEKYYRNNLINTCALLEAMRAAGVAKFIFSSSAAVYGEPQEVPIPETHPKNPLNPYGRSKWIVEQMLQDHDLAYGLRSISLRYFNAAGADPDGQLGERHEPETHLIPLVLGAASGSSGPLNLFGTDYDTPDGTCIRDYVHVTDLCDAHLLALEKLLDGGASDAFNLGNGNGFSVREIMTTAEKVTGCTVPFNASPRRAGDPARLVAQASRARSELGWQPRYADVDTIIAHTWRWHQHHRQHP